MFNRKREKINHQKTVIALKMIHFYNGDLI